MSEMETGAAPAAAEPAVTTPAATTPSEPASINDTLASVYDKHYPQERVNRSSDNGKFESKTPPAEAVEADPETPQEPVEATPEPARPAIARPQSWSADHDEWWSSLPPEKQEYLAKRESEAHQKISQLGATAKQAEQFNAIFDRYKGAMSQPAAQEVENLLYTKAQLLRDPPGSIKWLANELGVDLSQFAKTATDGQPAENDTVRSLQQEVAQLRRELGDTRNNITARERAEIQTREQSLQKLVEEFATGKDYWGDIEADVFQQVAAIRAVDKDMDAKAVLEKAHDRALKLNEAVSSRLNESKRKEEAGKKAAEDKRKADEAKKLAALNVKSSSGTSPKSVQKMDMATEMSEIYDRLAG